MILNIEPGSGRHFVAQPIDINSLENFWELFNFNLFGKD